jgi:hypothetical protein
VAAEYWGITLDVVWRRIYNRLIPHKSDGGFIFVDVDPWTPDVHGHQLHEAPPTFVASDAFEPAPAFDLPVIEHFAAEVREDEESEEDPPAADETEEAALPELDEEETATFGRLSWVEVRQQVSRTRRPPPSVRV